MSHWHRKLGKRKYYKQCVDFYAWRFAPTGKLQSAERWSNAQFETNPIAINAETVYRYLADLKRRCEVINDYICRSAPQAIMWDDK